MHLYPVFVAFVATWIPVHSAKFLLATLPSTSHCLEVISIGQELLQRGHHVTLFSHLLHSENCITTSGVKSYPKFKVVTPKVDPEVWRTNEEHFDAMSKMVMGDSGLFNFLITVPKAVAQNWCTSAFFDKKLLDELTRDNYDMALVDGTPLSGCICALPVYFGIPYAAVASYIDHADSRTPLQTATMPSIYSQFSNKMNFLERFTNTIIYFLNPALKLLMERPVDLSSYSPRLKGVNTLDLIQHSVLFLENSHYVFDYPKATFPNFVQVGGLTVRKAKPLPTDLDRYLTDARDGVIVVSFGSVLKHVPNKVVENILQALKRVKLKVLFKHNRDEIQENVKIIKWMPQNDVLGHPNTKLFISHCGKNGLWESVFHRVPIVCAPFGLDTIATSIKVKYYGIGSSIDNIKQALSDEIFHVVADALNNNSFAENIQRLSNILNEAPETPSARAASALEHVIKYGGSHMQPPSVTLSTFSLIYADIWITMFVSFIVVICISVCMCRRCFCRKLPHKMKAE